MTVQRTIEEVKNDIRDRVGHRAPFLHADKAEPGAGSGQDARLRRRDLGGGMERAWGKLARQSHGRRESPATLPKPNRPI